MKHLLFILLFPLSVQAQILTENRAKVAVCEFFAGYANAFRDQVLYHPNQLFARYPNLKGSFWDIRQQGEPGFLNMEWDADHLLKGLVVFSHLTAVAIKIGDGRPKIKTILRDLAVSLLAYKAGWVTGWVFVHGNKL